MAVIPGTGFAVEGGFEEGAVDEGGTARCRVSVSEALIWKT